MHACMCRRQALCLMGLASTMIGGLLCSCLLATRTMSDRSSSLQCQHGQGEISKPLYHTVIQPRVSEGKKEELHLFQPPRAD